MNPKIPHNFGRHGEVILRPVKEIPQGAKLIEKAEKIVIGHSETGHHHVLTLERGTGLVEMYEHEGRTYLRFGANADLIHQKEAEKHETQTFLPGMYERIIRHSYSYSEKIMKRVMD